MFQGISPQNMSKNMVRLRTSMYWILKFPLIATNQWLTVTNGYNMAIICLYIYIVDYELVYNIIYIVEIHKYIYIYKYIIYMFINIYIYLI